MSEATLPGKAEFESVALPRLSKRELFAAMAMQGMVSKVIGNPAYATVGALLEEALIPACVEIADLLIAELEKKP